MIVFVCKIKSNLKALRKSLEGRSIKRYLFALVIFLYLPGQINAIPKNRSVRDTAVTSTQQQAIEFIDKINELGPSKYWPNIKPALFLQNLKTTIYKPISIYPGNGTNFCGYGALTYLLLLDDPLGYAKLLLQLYKEGSASFGDIHFNPSASVKKSAGLFRYKGILDIHPAEQMWFLSLADHFKGYLNFFNKKYEPGDEDKFWASVNYAKFNRMVRELLNYQVKAKGADLSRPKVGDLYKYISERMETGTVVLFINNRIVHKKNHVTIKLGVPTHFIVAEKISKENDVITMVYWDYGGKTQLQLSPDFFKRIVFGITYCTKKEIDAN
jgi:hypothetical protein